MAHADIVPFPLGVRETAPASQQQASKQHRSRDDEGVTSRERYDSMLRDEVGPWLRERGFKKRRNRFRREHDAGWQVVDFQASQWGSRDDVRFTINVWVGVSELQEADAGAQFQERVGSLLPEGEDHWWPVPDDTDTAALGQDLRQVLEDHCLPWLEKRTTLDQLIRLADEDPERVPALSAR